MNTIKTTLKKLKLASKRILTLGGVLSVLAMWSLLISIIILCEYLAGYFGSIKQGLYARSNKKS